MKKQMLSVVVAGVLGSVGSVQAGNMSSAALLLDYQEASSAYEEAYVNGNAFFGKNRGDDQAQYNFNVNVDYDKTISTPDRDLKIKANANGQINRAGTAGANSESSYTAGASVTADNYFQPGSNGAFWYGSASVQANDAFDDLETTAGIGVGYGRVVNVTPMAEAIRVIDELMKHGSITAKPGNAIYQQVANIIARKSEYVSKHGARDYSLVWISDIEQALKKGGVVNGTLNVAGVLRSRDVLLDGKISLRRHGWKVRAGLGYVGTNFDGLTNKPALEAGAEYHRPLSSQTQFSNEATLRAIINDGDNGYNLNNNMTLTHEVDDRIDWENGWALDYARNSQNGDDVTTNTLSSGFVYELNNSLDFTTSARIANVSGSSDAANPDGTDRSVLMGVRYRLR
uniref:Adenylate cyclase (EC) n=1 Tax=uncultured Thiotrichaceae bacterium TaxID=298394 RepID=A0A6S6TV58_9GAMM|nr:MAG: Adenylate cyclase (EC [uncultured Thiotrichaceae bacterium]